MEKQHEELYANLMNYAVALHSENKATFEVKEALKEKGLPEELADKISNQSYDLYIELVNKKANKNILWGAVWLLGGLFVTIASYNSGGGRYVLAYGAIIGGLVQLVSGFVQKNNA